MKKLWRLIFAGLYFLLGTSMLLAQQIDFTLKYNATTTQYEVYGISNTSAANYFVGGGSQLSIVLPDDIADAPLIITTVNGGVWTDNSQVFAPAVMPDHDFHGIASNGSQMEWVFGVETLLFTFLIPDHTCVPGIRLFENANDPSASEPSMLGSDFKNYFANVFTFQDNYRANYDNVGTSCGDPVVVLPDTIYIPQDSILVTCIPFTDPDNNDTHTFDFCDQLTNGTITGTLNNNPNEVCLTLAPDNGFSGMDQFCIIVCDQTGLCDSVIIPVVISPPPPIIPNNPPNIPNDTLIIPENIPGIICLPIQDADANDIFSTIVCDVNYGAVNLNETPTDMVCINYEPENNFTGTDEICLITCDAAGLCDTAYVMVLIGDYCSTLQPTISVTNTVCQNGLIQFSATPVDQADRNYTWLNGVGTPISNELTFSLNVNDDQAISPFSLQTQSGICPPIVSDTFAVTIISPPVISNLVAATNICLGDDLTLSAQNSNALGQLVNYTWTGPNGVLETGETTSPLFEIQVENLTTNQIGTYTLTLTADNGCGTSSQSINVQSTSGVEAPTLTALENIVCSGKDVELTATIQDDAEIEFEWFIQEENGDLTYLLTTEHPSLVFREALTTQSGDYLVRTKKGTCVSGFSNTEIITVFDSNTEISITHEATLNRPACPGSAVQLSTIFYENATYQWSGPNGFSATVANPIINNISALDAGEYQVIVTVEGCDPVSANPTTIYVATERERPLLQQIVEICEGENLTLNIINPIIPNDEENAQYDWYFSGTAGVLATTQTAAYDLGVASDKYAGEYYVVQKINGCSILSDTMTLTVRPALNLTAQTIDDFEICRAAAIDLIATVPAVGVGQWSSSTGAFILNPNESVTSATDLQTGLNEFIWRVKDDCGQEVSDTFRVNIQGLTSDVAFAGLDQQFCDQTSTQLNATTLLTANGIWTQSLAQASQGVIIESPENANTAINGLQPGNAYTFKWTISEGACTDFDADEITVIIDELPTETPFILTEDVSLCVGEQITLAATMPLFSTGQWTTNTNAIIANPSSSTTTVANLANGNNQFIWSLSSEFCKDYASDTLNVVMEDGFMANSDTYQLDFNDSIRVDVFANDSINDLETYRFTITKYPDFGSLTEEMDGTIKYVPYTNFFGEDNFRYKLCSNTCESLCDTARVDLLVTDVSGSGVCFVPNGLTPNGDEVNDQLIIPCLFGNTTSELIIFNRWGDEVYSAAPYLNDWGATHKGNPLPAGTYFYMLKVNQDDPEAIQGYLTVFR